MAIPFVAPLLINNLPFILAPYEDHFAANFKLSTQQEIISILRKIIAK